MKKDLEEMIEETKAETEQLFIKIDDLFDKVTHEEEKNKNS